MHRALLRRHARARPTSSKSVYHLWQGFSIGAVIIGGFVVVLFVYAIIRFRRKGDNIPRQSQYHLPAEVLYTVVPILVVFGLFAATLVVENKEVANPKTNVTVDVNAFQWGWKFTYPGTRRPSIGQTTQTPTMVIPVNTNVHINLTSTDVIHGFYVKEFNFSRYALPGVLNQFTIQRREDRHLLRPVHATLRSLPLAHVLQRESRHHAAVHRVAGEQREPRRAPRPPRRRPTNRPPRGVPDEAGLESRR